MVHPNSPRQEDHVDDTGRKSSRCFYTLIIPLTFDVQAGGTYFPDLNLTFTHFGGYVLFDENIVHAGLANLSKSDRFLLLAVIYTGRDEN